MGALCGREGGMENVCATGSQWNSASHARWAVRVAERIYSASSSTNVSSIQWQKPLSMAYRAPTVPPPSNPALSHTSPDHRWLIERFTVSMALPPKRDMRFRLSGSSV